MAPPTGGVVRVRAPGALRRGAERSGTNRIEGNRIKGNRIEPAARGAAGGLVRAWRRGVRVGCTQGWPERCIPGVVWGRFWKVLRKK